MLGPATVQTCLESLPPNKLDSFLIAPGRTRRKRFMALATLPFLVLSLAPISRAASFTTDANGFVVMEAENFDVNVTQNNGEWRFDATPLALDPFSGWGYMKGLFSGGTDTNLSPRLDYTVNFASAGTYYIWVSGSDAGGKSLHVGLNGVVPPTANDIGGPDGAFGTRYGGELGWLSNYNPGTGYSPGARPYLTVPTAGEHTVNVFIRDPGFYIDEICLTPDISFIPAPLYGGALAGLNVPAETVAPSASLSVAIAQPANGKTVYGGSNQVVTIVAKPATNGPSVTLVEFFTKLASASTYTKIGQANSKPYMISWSNSPSGSNHLIAVVTDASAQKATSAVVNVTIALPATFVTPLKWTTNNFDSGLGSFTLSRQTQEGGFDFGWQNSNHAGGLPGELGGLYVRRNDLVPFIAEPLSRPVSLNEELRFRGSMMLSNVSMNADTFLGYFDTNSLARFGLKIREPTSAGGVWRFRVEPGNTTVSPSPTMANNSVGQVELHWMPSGLGDGSGTLTGMVAGISFSPVVYTAPNAATFNAFGNLVPSQGDTATNIYSFQYFDNLVYLIPAIPVLNIQRWSGNQVLLSWDAAGYLLQFKEGAVTGGSWIDYNTNNVVQADNWFYATNSVGSTNRWYRLRHPE